MPGIPSFQRAQDAVSYIIPQVLWAIYAVSYIIPQNARNSLFPECPGCCQFHNSRKEKVRGGEGDLGNLPFPKMPEISSFQTAQDAFGYIIPQKNKVWWGVF